MSLNVQRGKVTLTLGFYKNRFTVKRLKILEIVFLIKEQKSQSILKYGVDRLKYLKLREICMIQI